MMELGVRVRERFEGAPLLSLKMQEGATSQGIQVASRSWKRQGNGFSLRNSRRNNSHGDTLILAQ